MNGEPPAPDRYVIRIVLNGHKNLAVHYSIRDGTGIFREVQDLLKAHKDAQSAEIYRGEHRIAVIDRFGKLDY